ncbi:MAG: MarR family transcriptional regulator [Candidatus Omnitrophota bacterium]|jgi:DNA-binding MarR family transcriptional regulator
MGKSEKIDFETEMVKIMPQMLREISRRQEGILTKGNIAVSDIIVMDALYEIGPCTMGNIARMLNLTMSAATVIVDRMIRNGLVKRGRSEKDRRVVNVELLKKGESIIKHVNSERKKMIKEMYSALSEQERKEYIRMIKKVYEGLRKRS